jgi:hypothetical protein
VHVCSLNPYPGGIVLLPPSHTATISLLQPSGPHARSSVPHRLNHHWVQVGASSIASLTAATSTPHVCSSSVPASMPHCLHRYRSTLVPSQPPAHRRVPDNSSISRSSRLSLSLDHLLLRELIQVLSISRLGTDSSIVHFSLRKLF